jgi:nucleoredoxin
VKKYSSLLSHLRGRTLTALVGCAVLFCTLDAKADQETGRLKHDLTVGPSNDVHLTADQTVQILKQSDQFVVIMVQLPDGSNGIYQVDPNAVEITAPSAAPSSAVAPMAPATNDASVNPVATAPASPLPSPVSQPATPPATATGNPQPASGAADSSKQPTGFASDLNGHLVVLDDGQLKNFDVSALQNVKYWAIYYSASWCPDCVPVSEELVRFYKEFKPAHPNFELIFVCHDKTQDAMLNYMKTDRMPWPALQFSDVWNRNLGALKYIAKGIPNLVLVDDDGKVLSQTYTGTDDPDPRHVIDDIKKLVPSPNP